MFECVWESVCAYDSVDEVCDVRCNCVFDFLEYVHCNCIMTSGVCAFGFSEDVKCLSLCDEW